MKKLGLFLLLLNQVAFSQDGALDTTFAPTQGANNTPFNILVQPNGKIIMVGFFTYYNLAFKNHIARLNASGSLDTSFVTGTGTDYITYTSALQADGKIIIGGLFTQYDGHISNHIARLNADGSFDTTFNTGVGTNNALFTTCIQPDGKIIIGGTFFYYNNITKNNIARLNADGTLDTSFNNGAGPNGDVIKAILQPDGKVIIGGIFTTYNGISRNRLARLNTDGSLDTTFNPGAGADAEIRTIALQNDGKIIIGGFFTSYDGTSINKLARINADGTLDTSFVTGTGPNDTIYTATLQQNQKVIIGGWFTDYNGTAANRIARLNTDGTFDTTFNSGVGPDDKVFCSAMQSDGKVILGGNFTKYNNVTRSKIVRIGGQNLSTTTNAISHFGITPNPSHFDINLQLDNHTIDKVVVTDMTGKTVLTETQNTHQINIENLSAGAYIVHAYSEAGTYQTKFIKE